MFLIIGSCALFMQSHNMWLCTHKWITNSIMIKPCFHDQTKEAIIITPFHNCIHSNGFDVVDDGCEWRVVAQHQGVVVTVSWCGYAQVRPASTSTQPLRCMYYNKKTKSPKFPSSVGCHLNLTATPQASWLKGGGRKGWMDMAVMEGGDGDEGRMLQGWELCFGG